MTFYFPRCTTCNTLCEIETQFPADVIHESVFVSGQWQSDLRLWDNIGSVLDPRVLGNCFPVQKGACLHGLSKIIDELIGSCLCGLSVIMAAWFTEIFWEISKGRDT